MAAGAFEPDAWIPGRFHAGTSPAAELDEGHQERVSYRPRERLTVNMVGRASEALELAVSLTGDTRTNAINRALQIYAYVELVMARGGAIYVRDAQSRELDLLKLL